MVSKLLPALIVTAGLGLGLASLALGQTDAGFPGIERGVQKAAEDGGAVKVGAADSSDGLELRVRSMLVDETQTTLEVEWAGREELGQSILPSGRLSLTGPDATRANLKGITSDPASHRRQTWVFGPIVAQPGSLRLAVDGVVYVTAESRPATRAGKWDVVIPFDGHRLPAAVAKLNPPVEASMGLARVVVEEVVQAPSGTILRGRLRGIDPSVVPNFRLEALLRVADSELAAVEVRGGFGEELSEFEFRFPRAEGQVELAVRPVAHPERLVDLAIFGGPGAEARLAVQVGSASE